MIDPKTGGAYYWNQTTNETTRVGAPEPTTFSLRDDELELESRRRAFAEAPPSMGVQIGQAFVMGAGVSMGFAAVGVLARVFF